MALLLSWRFNPTVRVPAARGRSVATAAGYSAPRSLRACQLRASRPAGQPAARPGRARGLLAPARLLHRPRAGEPVHPEPRPGAALLKGGDSVHVSALRMALHGTARWDRLSRALPHLALKPRHSPSLCSSAPSAWRCCSLCSPGRSSTATLPRRVSYTLEKLSTKLKISSTEIVCLAKYS